MRGLIGPVLAQGRPARGASARQLVALALAAMPAELSRRSRAQLLARRVVAELVAMDDRSEVEASLVRVALLVGADPALALAHDAALDLAGELARERLTRFEARGCRQLSAAAWSAETREIAMVLEKRCAERFRRM